MNEITTTLELNKLHQAVGYLIKWRDETVDHINSITTVHNEEAQGLEKNFDAIIKHFDEVHDVIDNHIEANNQNATSTENDFMGIAAALAELARRLEIVEGRQKALGERAAEGQSELGLDGAS